ncbi:MAG: hypothetical protein RJB13_2106, partial [Pseudomonadota bacterium]
MNTPIPSVMTAITFDRFGDESVLQRTTVTTPLPRESEILIEISHTSVNPVDWKIRMGYLKDMFPHIFPVIPGWDVAGTVVQVGSEVSDYKIGDRVAAYTRLPEVHNGTYAQYIAIPSDFAAKIPQNLSFEAVSGVPLVALTALQSLSDFSKIKSGDRVLVINGAGGVGSFAIQFARQAGGIVTATTSSKNTEYVRSLGASRVVDYTKTSILEITDSFDFVFDALGGESLKQAMGLVRSQGQVVSIVESPDEKLASSREIHASFHFVAPNGAQLQRILDGIASGMTKIPSYEVLSINDARK